MFALGGSIFYNMITLLPALIGLRLIHFGLGRWGGCRVSVIFRLMLLIGEFALVKTDFSPRRIGDFLLDTAVGAVLYVLFFQWTARAIEKREKERAEAENSPAPPEA